MARMGIETEVKIKIESADDFIGRVLSQGADRVSERSFEDNILFDFPDGRLRTAQCILRVRFVDGRGVLTYKGVPRAEGIFKSREELETAIEDPETAIEILGRIGMRQGFRYQKYRQEFVFGRDCCKTFRDFAGGLPAIGSREKPGGVLIAVDETPIGNYAELEGEEEEILNLAGKLNIAESLFIRLSYHSLYLDYCRVRGITPQSMTF